MNVIIGGAIIGVALGVSTGGWPIRKFLVLLLVVSIGYAIGVA